MSTPLAPAALVTGSGRRRIGNQVARELAAAGYRVAIHCHRSVETAEQTAASLRERGAQAVVLRADLTVESEVEQLVAGCLLAFGRLDVLVCTAAVWQPTSFETVTAQDLRRQWDLNALATFLCARQAGMVMVRQAEGGSIVTMGDWAIGRPYPDHAAYFASKGSIPTITRVLAVELAQRNPRVRVNCILPGPVMLPPDLSAQERQAVIEATLLRREGRPDNIAHAVRFLIENDFVTGVCLPVDGGRSIYAPGP